MKRPFVNVTIPVYNEEKILAESIGKVDRFLVQHAPFDYEIVIANNASTDRTRGVADDLCRGHGSVRAIHLEQKGRGRAVRKAWNESNADILSYMDVDLSADLHAFPPIIDAIVNGGFDLATGSRLLDPSSTTRGLKREVLSRGYNLLVKVLFRTRFSDAQCGFKAITRQAATALLPLVEDNAWFFDSELLILAEKLDYRIFDLPVHWVDDPDTRVKIWSTAIADIKGLIRVRKRRGGR